ncbi:PGG domain - like 10 [Theobroma cacao]|nr:PGG domain - like 10 [Theobroma cacao]
MATNNQRTAQEIVINPAPLDVDPLAPASMRDVSDESAGEPFAPTVTPSEEERTRFNYYRPLYLTALKGNWEAAKGYFADDVSEAFTEDISCKDISLDLIQREPSLILAESSEGETILQVLAYEPAHFHSGTKLNFWEKWIYQYLCDEDDPLETSDQDLGVEKQSQSNEAKTQVYQGVKKVLWRRIKNLVPCINKVTDKKLGHERACKLVHLCLEALLDYNERKRNEYFDKQKILHFAARCGVVEIVTASLHYFPDLIFSEHGSLILKNAIQCRQEKIFNLACKKTSLDKMFATMCYEPSISHLAAKLPIKQRIEHPRMRQLRSEEGKTALFSSVTAILMFLSILTSSYKEEDFHRALPKRMIIGLASLFFALATMMVAFGAALAIVLSEKIRWVWGPIIFLASFPVTLFFRLQLPLFIEMIQSTYGSIFQREKIWRLSGNPDAAGPLY